MLFTIGIYFLFKKRIISPLAKLEAGANAIKEDNYSQKIDIFSKDEVGTLARSFNEMAD
ncbi:MAG: HAMP domain-containing protein [Gammaproteobacteria bacterium]|nr:HAMP domain-containing protein [Gammaproteobacteria bacterium]